MFKKTLAVLAISILGLGIASAQHRGQQFENKTPEEIAELKTKRMTQRLDLTTDQIVKVQGVLLESATHKMEIQENYPQVKEAKAEMNDIRKGTKVSVQEILSPEQQAKMKEMHRSGNKRMKNGYGGEMNQTSGKQRMNKMQENLDLTDSQVEKLTQIFERNQVYREEIKAKYPELAAAKKEMKQNRDDTQNQLKKVLTPAQFKMLNEGGQKKGKECNNGKKGKG